MRMLRADKACVYILDCVRGELVVRNKVCVSVCAKGQPCRDNSLIQVTVAALPPFGGTEIDHPRNILPLAIKYLEGTKSCSDIVFVASWSLGIKCVLVYALRANPVGITPSYKLRWRLRRPLEVPR